MNQEISSSVEQVFTGLFGNRPLMVMSPGRVNIIGEHTDYNNGFVLPAAIDKAVYIGIGPRNDNLVKLYSAGFAESYEVIISALEPASNDWPNYILGVADQFRKRGCPIRGFNLVIDGDVPIGSGLSSSAAVECATAFGLNEIFNLQLGKKELALLAQKAEHEFAGVRCGIMDQFASLFGKKDHVIKLDCRSLEYEYVPLDLKGYSILLLNTNVKHSLASSEYNTRRQQCESGVEMIRKHHPEVNSLRDVTMEMLDRFVKPYDELVYTRCKYVVEENQRLLQGCEDLRHGDLDKLGQKMFQSHDGLSKEYEVSCPELDFLVEAVRNHPDVVGARMMGGGFGGCTINIVRQEAIEALINELSVSYMQKMKKELTAYVARVGEGTRLI